MPGIRDMANTTVDVWAVLAGIWTGTIPQQVAAAYDRVLFKGQDRATDPGAPLFIYDSSNLQTGALWRFTREYMGDYKIGYIEKPDLPLSVAVGASSAFPPILSPVVLKSPGTFRPAAAASGAAATRAIAHASCFPTAAYTTISASSRSSRAPARCWSSDGGSPFKTQPRPCGFWPLQIVRVLMCEDNQVRGLRKRGLIERYQLHTGLENRTSPVWSNPDAAASRAQGHLLGHHHHAELPDGAAGCPARRRRPSRSRSISTRLASMKEATRRT